jgi:hypothetical protein
MHSAASTDLKSLRLDESYLLRSFRRFSILIDRLQTRISDTETILSIDGLEARYKAVKILGV